MIMINLKKCTTMAKINYIKERLLRMCDQSTNPSIRELLTNLRSSMVAASQDSQASVVAEALVSKIQKYSRCYCSEKQAYVIVSGIYEY